MEEEVKSPGASSSRRPAKSKSASKTHSPKVSPQKNLHERLTEELMVRKEIDEEGDDEFLENKMQFAQDYADSSASDVSSDDDLKDEIYGDVYMPDFFFLPQSSRSAYRWEPYGNVPVVIPQLETKDEYEKFGQTASSAVGFLKKFQYKEGSELRKVDDEFKASAASAKKNANKKLKMSVSKGEVTKLDKKKALAEHAKVQKEIMKKRGVARLDTIMRHNFEDASGSKDGQFKTGTKRKSSEDANVENDQEDDEGVTHGKSTNSKSKMFANDFDLRVPRVIWALEHQLALGHVQGVASALGQFCKNLDRAGIIYDDGTLVRKNLSTEHGMAARPYLAFFELLMRFADMIPLAGLFNDDAIDQAIAFNPSLPVIRSTMLCNKASALIACGKSNDALAMLLQVLAFKLKTDLKVTDRKIGLFKYHYKDYWRFEEVPFIQAFVAMFQNDSANEYIDVAFALLFEREIVPPTILWKRYYELKKGKPLMVRRVVQDCIEQFGGSPILYELFLLTTVEKGNEVVNDRFNKFESWYKLLGNDEKNVIGVDLSEMTEMWNNFALTCDVGPKILHQVVISSSNTACGAWRFLSDMPLSIQVGTLCTYALRKPDDENAWHVLARIISEHAGYDPDSVMEQLGDRKNAFTNLLEEVFEQNTWSHAADRCCLLRYMVHVAHFIYLDADDREEFYVFLQKSAQFIANNRETWPPQHWDISETEHLLKNFLAVNDVADTPLIPFVFGFNRRS